MTERHGRRARWTALLVVAPGAAALLRRTTSWALHTTPATAKTTASAPQAAAPAAPVPRVVDAKPALTALARRAAANEHQVATLQTQLAQLRKQLTTLTAPVAQAGGGQPVTTGSGGGYVSGSAAAPVQAQAQTAPAAAAPASGRRRARSGSGGARPGPRPGTCRGAATTGPDHDRGLRSQEVTSATSVPLLVAPATVSDTITTFRAMAGDVTVRIGAGQPGAAAATREVASLFAAVEAQCTRFDPGSDLMQANAAATGWQTVSALCFDALSEAAAARDRAEVFDPRTLQTLVALGYDRSLPFVEGPVRLPGAPTAAVESALTTGAGTRPRWQPEFDPLLRSVRIGPCRWISAASARASRCDGRPS